MLAEASRRTAWMPNVRVLEADAVTYRCEKLADCVYFSYSLTMIPDWRSALDNALSLLRPGGLLGVVDFFVSEASPPAGAARHGAFDRFFWPRWFARDGVRPCPDHLRRLQELLPDHVVEERRAPVPYLPGLRVPYYLFIGRKAGA
jgi:S-adenosylmethionine-diacylgycerolhomoserine-N-methlytransferase